ncbi:hypothetical protein [Geobacillus sp. Sah69]|uniref:hypothetical protein n=1 Tax=Geobacillus sp. Sah69 TaxID=1737624 RepID=UPI0006DBD8E2|nr:hypothetical protein [Geobacillus sp. Sah69]
MEQTWALKREQLMKTYGYVDEDAIDPKKVRAYQFRMQGQDTIITPLIPTENGFPAETFNEVIWQLNEETYAFQIGEEDGEDE